MERTRIVTLVDSCIHTPQIDGLAPRQIDRLLGTNTDKWMDGAQEREYK